MASKDHLDFWYAVNNTEIVVMPQRHLETFGATTLNYHMVSELMDVTDQIRVREGRMLANQPKIVTPEAYSQTLLEGFGEEAGKYVEWLKEHEKQIQVLQYGYRLKQEAFSEHVVTGDVRSVLERVKKEVKGKDAPLGAVVLGVDDPWDVCLVKLFWEVIRNSARTNIHEMQRRHLFDSPEATKERVRDEIEQDFLAASKNPALIAALGKKLQQHGLFHEYEDRFFALVKAGKRR